MRLTTSLILLLQTFYSFAQTPSDYKFQSIGIAQGASKISTHTAPWLSGNHNPDDIVLVFIKHK